LTQGATERTIVEQCSRNNSPLPKAIRDAPDLALGLEFTYSAFWELSGCRSVGFGIGFIPWSAIADYAKVQELDREDADDFIYLIRAMDRAFVAYNSEAAKKPDPQWQKT
jgi:hypothetical protein